MRTISMTILVAVTCLLGFAQGRFGGAPGGGRPAGPAGIGRGMPGFPGIGAPPIGISPSGPRTAWPPYVYPPFPGYVGPPPGANPVFRPFWCPRAGWPGSSGWNQGFPNAPSSFVGAAFYAAPVPIDSGQYYQQPIYSPPVQNMPVVMPPPPIDFGQPVPAASLQSKFEPPAPSAPIEEPTTASRPSPQNEDYPALVALKNGGIYSASNYWVSGSNFHFITTQGDQMTVAMNSVERVFPPQKNGRSVQPAGAPRR
jgi:hypothetical protein